MRGSIIALACLVGLIVHFQAPLSGAAAAPDPPSVLEVRKVYQQCRAAKADTSSSRVTAYADYGDFTDNRPPVWRKTLPASGEAYSSVDAWRTDGSLRVAARVDTSPSGDWSKSHEYCFRKDGTLAFILAELRTFNGGVRVEDRFYYSPAGKQVRKLRYVFDLMTNARKPDTFSNFFDRDTTVYPTTDTLMTEIGEALK